MKYLVLVLFALLSTAAAFAEDGDVTPESGNPPRLFLNGNFPSERIAIDDQQREEHLPAGLLVYRKQSNNPTLRRVELRATASLQQAKPVVGVLLTVAW
jgi:hypothetical protein